MTWPGEPTEPMSDQSYAERFVIYALLGLAAVVWIGFADWCFSA